jgi:hypothetical protein
MAGDRRAEEILIPKTYDFCLVTSLTTTVSFQDE